MKLYHATKSANKDAASEVAEQIEQGGFVAQFDHNHQAEVICLTEKPLTGWGGWRDAWVVVEVDDKTAKQYQYTFDDDLYNTRCYAFPADVINQFPIYATTENETKESPMWEGAE